MRLTTKKIWKSVVSIYNSTLKTIYLRIWWIDIWAFDFVTQESMSMNESRCVQTCFMFILFYFLNSYLNKLVIYIFSKQQDY